MTNIRRYNVGETIFREGAESDVAYLIVSGRVEIVKHTDHGALRVAVLQKGDLFGEMGLIDERPRSATARAAEAVVASVIDRAEFIEILTKRPAESLTLLRTLFERLRSMNQRLAGIAGTGAGVAGPERRVHLYPLSAAVERAIPRSGLLVERFPFRIGRRPGPGESSIFAYNDLEIEDAEPYVISLNHLAIDADANHIIVRERGSRWGTVVNGIQIGGTQQRDMVPLPAPENEVVIGRPESPYRLKVSVAVV